MFIDQMKDVTDVWQTTVSVLQLRRRARSQCIVSTTCCIDNNVSIHVKESGFREQGNFCCGIRYPGLWNPEYSLKKIWNPTKDWNPVAGIRNPRHGIQNPRLSWIPSHEPKCQSNQARWEKGRFSIGLGRPHKIIKCFVSYRPPSREGGSVGRARKKKKNEHMIAY